MERERGERGNNSIIIGFQSINCREKSGTCIDDSPSRKCSVISEHDVGALKI